MFRQGDVLLVPVKSIPDYARPEAADGGRIVLAFGEATGHAHVVKAPQAEAFSDGYRRYLNVPQTGAVLTHEEHEPIPLPGGAYRIVIQREFDPTEDRLVVD